MLLFTYMDYIILHLTNMKLYVLVVVFYILGIIPWSIGLNGHLGLKLCFCLDIGLLSSLFSFSLSSGLSLWAMVVATIGLTLFTFASLLGIILGSLLDNISLSTDIISISLVGITLSISLYGHLYGRLCFSTLGFGSYSLPFYVMVFYSIGLTLFWLCLTTLGLNLCLPSKDIGLLPSLINSLSTTLSTISSIINSLVIKLGLCLSGIILPSLCLGYLSIYVGYLRPYPILSDSVLALLLGIIHDIITGIILLSFSLLFCDSVIVSSIYATLSTTLYPIEIDLLDIELSFIFPRGLGPFIAWPSISSLRILGIILGIILLLNKIGLIKPNTLRAIPILIIGYFLPSILLFMLLYLLLYLLYLLILIIIYLKKVKLH